MPLAAALCVLLACSQPALCQSMHYLGIEQGLSNNSVTSIYKDPHGFVWIGTNDGLNRYDGSSVRVYRNVWSDGHSLIDNHINKLAGYGNKIFVGTQKGLVCYNYDISGFEDVGFKSANGKITAITGNVNALQIDSAGNLYIGTDDQGLFVRSKNSGICTKIQLNADNHAFTVQAVAVGRDNRIWVLVRDRGLFCLQKNKLTLIDETIKYANCLTADTGNKVWIGTDNDLFFYDGKLQRLVKAPFNGKLNSDKIIDVKIDKSGDMWIATNGGGINIVKPKGDVVQQIVSERNNNLIVRSDAVSAIYEDNESTKWIATLRGGLYTVDSQPNKFRLIANDPFNKNSLVNNFVLSFCEDEHNNIWIGTDGGGLSYWNRKKNLFTNYKTDKTNQSSLRSNFVVSIVKDADNQIWVGLFNGGIDRFDKATGRFVHYDCFNTATGALDRNLWKLYVDHHNHIWAGTTRGGALYLYDKIKDKFELFDAKLLNIHAFYEDHNGTLWAGDYKNLIKIDIKNKHHQFIDVKKAVRSITEDKEHYLWLGTEGGGLIKFDVGNQKLQRFTEASGLQSNSILNVLTDDGDNIWANSYNGLIQFERTKQSFKNYSASDGLQINQFNYNAALRLTSGELVFGGIKGFSIFRPDSLSVVSHGPQLKLTGFKINNRSIENDSFYTKGVGFIDLKKITLPYNDATLAISYTTPEYSYPDKVKYEYILEGWDHRWNEVGNAKTAYYSRLNEGDYTFKIKATNTDGSWSNKQLQLQIIVMPPWYRTWWAYLAYLSVASFAVYWIWRYRTKQADFKYEIRLANLNTEREKELNEKKLAFFTNVSHEFRTPLTLIINPIKDLLHQPTGHSDELNTIYRNARRLLGLVDQLLLFRKAESVNDSLNLADLHISTLCHDVYLCFVQHAKSRQINYQYFCDSDETIIKADREKIEIAVFNLVSNALKFTPNGGEVMLYLTKGERTIELKVVDTGCGVSPEEGKRIFDKFYQVKDNTARKGFGIGLHLVKNFVESHNGTINYFNNQTTGATFVMHLPYKEDLNDYSTHVIKDDEQDLSNLLNDVDGLINWQQPVDEPVTNLPLLISDKQSVLIIDDNAGLRSYIRKIFHEDFNVHESENAENGLEAIKRRMPDVVICDINMEGISGIELCAIIKQDSSLSHIPVILLTGDPDPESRLKGIEVGAIDFVSKPFDKDLLVARVQGILKDRLDLQKYFYNEITLKENTRSISEHHREFLYKIIAIIEEHIIDPDFEVKSIADEMGISYSSLFKTIKSITGQSVNGFVRFVKLRKAAEMMIDTECNVNEAALNTGFNDIKYFREQFIKQFGIKPSEFIKQHRAAFHKKYSVEKAIV